MFLLANHGGTRFAAQYAGLSSDASVRYKCDVAAPRCRRMFVVSTVVGTGMEEGDRIPRADGWAMWVGMGEGPIPSTHKSIPRRRSS